MRLCNPAQLTTVRVLKGAIVCFQSEFHPPIWQISTLVLRWSLLPWRGLSAIFWQTCQLTIPVVNTSAIQLRHMRLNFLHFPLHRASIVSLLSSQNPVLEVSSSGEAGRATITQVANFMAMCGDRIPPTSTNTSLQNLVWNPPACSKCQSEWHCCYSA